MKIRIITDVHSNIIALNEVLNEFGKIKVDKIICCGDIIGIGPNPEEAVDDNKKVYYNRLIKHIHIPREVCICLY